MHVHIAHDWEHAMMYVIDVRHRNRSCVADHDNATNTLFQSANSTVRKSVLLQGVVETHWHTAQLNLSSLHLLDGGGGGVGGLDLLIPPLVNR